MNIEKNSNELITLLIVIRIGFLFAHDIAVVLLGSIVFD